jgi:anti-anti-sigma regulatory factor
MVDLKECSGSDSTFMGALAGIALRARELGSGSLHVLNAPPEQEKQLRNLGLDRLFSIE